MSAPSTTTTTATATATNASNIITTVSMTAIFTPPPACAKSWTYEPEVYNNVAPSGLLMQNCETVVSSCFPSGFADSGRRTATLIYSPGYCPMGYTSADLAINGPTTSAVCCLSNFSYTTSTMFFSNLPPAMYAGCTSIFDTSSSTVVAARASQSDQGTMIFGPMVMWAQPITVLLQSSDSSLFVTSTSMTSSSTVSSTTSTTSVSSTSSLQPSQTTQPTPSSTATPTTGLSPGAKAGVGIGVAIGVLAVLGLIAWWLRSRKTKKGVVAPPNNQNEYYSGPSAKNGSPVELAHRDAKYGIPAEVQTIPISELQG